METVLFKDLTDNVVKHGGGNLLLAGRHQFKTLWIRDGSFALLSLLEGFPIHSRERDFAMRCSRNLIDAYLKFRTKGGGIGPKCIDVKDPEYRVVAISLWRTICGVCGLCDWTDVGERVRWDEAEELHPMYVDRRNSSAIDSDILVALLAIELKMDRSIIDSLLSRYERNLSEDSQTIGAGLVSQPPYSDWQDSVDRSPYTFHINLLYWRALTKLGRMEEANELRRRMFLLFLGDEGLFRSMFPGDGGHVSLEDQLFALDWGFVGDGLFNALKRHPLWTSRAIPGFPTFPDYPRGAAHWQARIGGLGHYHDSLHWSWTTAYAGIIAHKFRDTETSDRIWGALTRAVERDGTVAEIYQVGDDGELKLFTSMTYRAEMPWTWGVAYTLRFAGARAATNF